MSLPMLPDICVIIPVHDRADLIKRAIDSVLGQSHANFELIVVDDGSSDATAEVVGAVRDPRLTLIRLDHNMGGNAARNRGIEASSAPLLTFLDSDDVYLPDKLKFVVQWFREHRDHDVLLDSFRKTYRPERDRPDIDLRNPVLDDNDAIVEALFTRRIWKATPGINVRRATALAAGLFDPNLKRRQDFDFILRLAAVGSCATTDEILWTKTYSNNTISADLRGFASATLQFYRLHPQYYDHPVYRRGFAHDLGRHFSRLARKRQWRIAARDARQFVDVLGLMRFTRLIVSGVGLFAERRQAVRRLVRPGQRSVTGRPV